MSVLCRVCGRGLKKGDWYQLTAPAACAVMAGLCTHFYHKACAEMIHYDTEGVRINATEHTVPLTAEVQASVARLAHLCNQNVYFCVKCQAAGIGLKASIPAACFTCSQLSVEMLCAPCCRAICVDMYALVKSDPMIEHKIDTLLTLVRPELPLNGYSFVNETIRAHLVALIVHELLHSHMTRRLFIPLYRDVVVFSTRGVMSVRTLEMVILNYWRKTLMANESRVNIGEWVKLHGPAIIRRLYRGADELFYATLRNIWLFLLSDKSSDIGILGVRRFDTPLDEQIIYNRNGDPCDKETLFKRIRQGPQMSTRLSTLAAMYEMATQDVRILQSEKLVEVVPLANCNDASVFPSDIIPKEAMLPGFRDQWLAIK